jgi:transporter family-2 protein
MPFLLMLAAFAAGGINTFQQGANATLKKTLAAPLWTLAIVSGVTFFGSLLVVLVKREHFPSSALWAAPPWWAWTGGLFGLVYVLAMIYTADKIGSAVFTGLTVTASLLVSLALDHFGWVGFEEHRLNLLRVAGAVLLIVGVSLIAKG